MGSVDCVIDVSLRAARPGDEDFLYRVYASTREAEMALVDWDEAQKKAFLGMQFEAQDRYYHENYTGTTFDVILAEGAPAGRLYVARWPEEIRIVDIALLPRYRNAGIGSALIKGIVAEAEAAGKKVSIHVEQFNPAMRLYERLGFSRVSERGVYYLMEWHPQPPC